MLLLLLLFSLLFSLLLFTLFSLLLLLLLLFEESLKKVIKTENLQTHKVCWSFSSFVLHIIIIIIILLLLLLIIIITIVVVKGREGEAGVGSGLPGEGGADPPLFTVLL